MSDELIDGGDEPMTHGDGESLAGRPSRRVMLTAAAWTVPAVIIGTAAPALAASSAPLQVGFGTFCKHNGGTNSGKFHLQTTWSSSFTKQKDIRIRSIKVGTTTLRTVSNVRPDDFDLPALASNLSVIFHFTLAAPAPPAGSTVVITYCIGDGDTTYTATSGALTPGTCTTNND